MNSLGNDYVYKICEDNSGFIWLATYGGGLSRFDKKNNEFRRFKNNPKDKYSLSGNLVMTIEKDNSGKLWIGTYDNGLTYLDPDIKENEKFKFINFRHDPDNLNSLSSNDVRSIYTDKKGIVWIGTWGGGLNRLIFKDQDKKKPQFKHYKMKGNNKSITNNIILSIHEDKSGIIWLGTFQGGLKKFDPVNETFKSYLENDGLPNNVVYGILEDDRGNFWLSTNKGISKFNPRTETI